MARYKRSAPSSGPRRSSGSAASVDGRQREVTTLVGATRKNAGLATAGRRKRRLRPGELRWKFRIRISSVLFRMHHWLTATYTSE
jgi:hypothetical protein